MIKVLVFEYILFKLSKWFLDIRKANWEEFNYLNDFGKNKTTLIPFSVCMANGSETRAVLLEVFDKFYSDPKWGIVEEEINQAIQNNTLQNFKFSEDRVQIICSVSQVNQTIAGLLQQINDPIIIEKIERSFNVLEKRTENHFPIYKLETLRIDNIQHTAYRKNLNENLIRKITLGNNPPTIYMKADMLITEKSVYAEKISERTFA